MRGQPSVYGCRAQIQPVIASCAVIERIVPGTCIAVLVVCHGHSITSGRFNIGSTTSTGKAVVHAACAAKPGRLSWGLNKRAVYGPGIAGCGTVSACAIVLASLDEAVHNLAIAHAAAVSCSLAIGHYATHGHYAADSSALDCSGIRNHAVHKTGGIPGRAPCVHGTAIRSNIL